MTGESIIFTGKERINIASLLKDLTNTFTYEFWINPSAEHQIDREAVVGISGTCGQRYVVFPGHGQQENEAGIGISIGTNGISVYEHTVNHLPATLVHLFLIKNWTHIAVVYKNKTPFLYINGEFVKKGLATTKETLYASGVFGGSEYGYFIGELREPRVWSYARTPAEIKEEMNKRLTGSEAGLYIYNELRNNRIEGTRNNLENIINKYPIFIKENIDLLYRWGIINDNQSLNLKGINKMNILRNTLDTYTFQNEWYLSDVLFMFGCYRKDYEHLLFPVANRLAEKGLSVHVIIHDKSSPNLNMLSKKVNILYYDKLLREYNTHKKAIEYFNSNMLRYLDKFSHEMGLNAAQKKRLQVFYRIYAIDKIFTTNLLAKLRPKCMYSIHFILNPGCINAIKTTRYPVPCFLIQHGLINPDSSGNHDFKGADLVFLWGEFFNSILKEKVNAPNTKVLGNPKIEQIRFDIKGNSDLLSMPKTMKEKEALNILYIFTGSPKQGYNTKNLTLFFKGISPINNIEVIYKLHPTSSLDDCQNYISQGYMEQSQIIKDGNTYDLIKQADIIVGDFSTSIFEAAALNKPVIQIFQNNYSEKFIKFTHVKLPDELTKIINRLRDDKKFFYDFMVIQQKTLFDLFTSIDGSAERISSYIDKLINGK
ncbi:CDP-glycerol glycerophosphotransferase family protein [Peribacillus frigoritolerans]|uniref:LamG-like jellyroll fold domain-containing protein n=1 Tax=Peribacillus frigoritolerans TaxID=450367 RepID=UPI00343A96C7